MPFQLKSILAGLAVVLLFAAGGCSPGGDQDRSPTTSIAGPDAKQTGPSVDPAAPATGTPESDPLHPLVVIETSKGDITVRLDAEKAPLTVDNFLCYTETGHYQQTVFHQVLQGNPKVVIGGAFTPDLVEKRTRTPIRNEAHNGLSNTRGTIAMARQPDAIDSATCHFFINVSDNAVLDHKDRSPEGYGYCVFGAVAAGMEVVDSIAGTEVKDTEQFERIPIETVMIKSVRRLR